MMTKKKNEQDLLRAIPKVDEFLGWVADDNFGEAVPLSVTAPLAIVKQAVREVLAWRREAILLGDLTDSKDLGKDSLLSSFSQLLSEKMQPNFRTLINATGVVVHTNLGRSLLPDSAVQSIAEVGAHYSNLEFDLRTGKRGSRYSLVEEILCDLTGAEAALVVNNNAAAVFLVLGTLAAGREVIVSRGQLVEIGGSFRIPDVMAKSGALLVEVGATNRTHLRDYEQAITAQTAMLLKVHTSNYRMIGFTSEVPLVEMASLARAHGLMSMEDLGSGCLVDLSPFGLCNEPTVGEVVSSGVDVVTFSGDKLLGGPQAGLVVGKKDIIAQIKKNPLNRALRIDKFTLAGLEATLRLYYDHQSAFEKIPTLAMLSAPIESIVKKARRLIRQIKEALAEYCYVYSLNTCSKVGGGAMPEQDLPTQAVALKPFKITVNELEEGLRKQALPVIGRIENDQFILDMRTVSDKEVTLLAQCLKDFFLS
jgi:L-seryl-tRNA(Ser) seleniumtransferase